MIEAFLGDLKDDLVKKYLKMITKPNLCGLKKDVGNIERLRNIINMCCKTRKRTNILEGWSLH